MEWLQDNWLWIALGVGFVAIHMFGHGGHQHGHSRRNGQDGRDQDSTNDIASEPQVQRTQPSGSASTTSGSNEVAQSGATTHAGHAASKDSSDGNRHRHGC